MRASAHPSLSACHLLLLVLVTLVGNSLHAMDRSRAEQVFAIADAFADGGELEVALAALAEAEVDADELREILVDGREPEQEPGRKTIEVTDGYGRKTEVVLTVPRGYDPRKPAGVAILLHGLGGDGSQLSGLLGDFAEKEGLLVACPTAQSLPGSPNPDTEIIQNMPQAAGTHWWSYGSKNFVLTLLRQLGRDFNLDRDQVLLSGYSMGGFGTWNIGMRFSDRFAAFVPFAGGISGREYLGGDDELMRSLLANLVGKPLFFIHGDADMTVPVRFAQRSDEQLQKSGNRTHVYLEVPGGSHRLDVGPGSSIMSKVEKWLKGKKREANPRELQHTLCDTDHGSCYWVKVEELAGSTGTVQARARSKGKLEVVAQGISRLTVRLNEDLAKPGKTVSIKLNGKRAFKGKYEPSLETLLETWAESEDPALLYDAEIELEAK